MTERESLAVEATAVAARLTEMAHAGENGRVNKPLIRALGDAGLLPPPLSPPRRWQPGP